VLYFGMIWCTAIATAYVNDSYFKVVIRQLVNAYHQKESLSHGQDQEYILTVTKLLSVKGSEGIHFAGVSIRTERAVGIGSLFISLMALAIRLLA
jgi:hypothetical protein